MKQENPIPGTDAMVRSIEPERDLWPAIEARIQECKVVRPRFSGRREPPRTRATLRRWAPLGVAAMLLVAVSSGITAYLIGVPPAATEPGPIPAAAGDGDIATVAWDQFQQAESEYQRVTDELVAALDARRDELAPETVEIVESNLRLIDQAIQTARTALQQDPASARLALKLNDIYRKRMNFLRQISRL